MPEDKQIEVLKFVEDIGIPRRSLFDIVKEIEETIPTDVLEKLPVDGSVNHDHYLYGAPKNEAAFHDALEFYEARLDKGLTDCISMNVCRTKAISQILTNDKHFNQEGFNSLLTN